MRGFTGLRLLLAAGVFALQVPAAGAVAAEAEGPLIRSVRVETGVEGKVGVFFRLSGYFIPACFGIAGDLPRFVCDFDDTRLAEGIETEIATKGRILSRIRIGRHGEQHRKVRVVLDLKPAAGFHIEQIFVEENNEYVLIVQPE